MLCKNHELNIVMKMYAQFRSHAHIQMFLWSNHLKISTNNLDLKVCYLGFICHACIFPSKGRLIFLFDQKFKLAVSLDGAYFSICNIMVSKMHAASIEKLFINVVFTISFRFFFKKFLLLVNLNHRTDISFLYLSKSK